MATMTKKKLITTISQDQGIHPNHVRAVIQNFLDKMTDALAKGDRLEFRDFGVLQVVERNQKLVAIQKMRQFQSIFQHVVLLSLLQAKKCAA